MIASWHERMGVTFMTSSEANARQTGSRKRENRLASLLCWVKRGGAVERSFGELAVGEKGHGCAGLGVERETTVDQTLIRGLVTAFRVFV